MPENRQPSVNFTVPVECRWRNARLFDDFELEAVRVEVIDGKNLW